jgi:leucyl-tRNA synthetase
MVLHDMGLIDFDEPFSNFFAHGLIIKDGAKMSKSRGNVVSLDEYIDKYGADALRIYLMFMGPFAQGGDFRDASMEGVSRWVGRVWRLAKKSLEHKEESRNPSSIVSPSAPISPSARIATALARLVAKVTDDLEKRRYNTAIAGMMEFTNLVADNGDCLTVAELSTLTLLLAPFAPFLSEELWQIIHNRSPQTMKKADSVHMQSWPTFDKTALIDTLTQIVVQVNGKTRDILSIPTVNTTDKAALESAARASEKASHYLEPGVKKVIVVPGKLVNFVV